MATVENCPVPLRCSEFGSWRRETVRHTFVTERGPMQFCLLNNKTSHKQTSKASKALFHPQKNVQLLTLDTENNLSAEKDVKLWETFRLQTSRNILCWFTRIFLTVMSGNMNADCNLTANLSSLPNHSNWKPLSASVRWSPPVTGSFGTCTFPSTFSAVPLRIQGTPLCSQPPLPNKNSVLVKIFICSLREHLWDENQALSNLSYPFGRSFHLCKDHFSLLMGGGVGVHPPGCAPPQGRWGYPFRCAQGLRNRPAVCHRPLPHAPRNALLGTTFFSQLKWQQLETESVHWDEAKLSNQPNREIVSKAFWNARSFLPLCDKIVPHAFKIAVLKKSHGAGN